MHYNPLLYYVPTKISKTFAFQYLPELDIQILLQTLQDTIAGQAKIITALTEKVKALEAELAAVKNKKNSNNSHMPPSKDENRVKRNQSLRIKTSLKPGGQPGHEGKTLGCRAVPDETVKHSVCFCNCCGSDLTGTDGVLVSARQVIDIIPASLKYTEHRLYKKQCRCGHTTQGSFPAHVTGAVQYGPNVEALAGYLHARQYMPYQRMKEFLNDVMQLPVSTGGINNILQRLAQKALPVYEQIKQRIGHAAFAGTDETGLNINGKTNWMWVWQNDGLTFLACSDNRGFKTIGDTFPAGFPNTVLQHDRLACHFKATAKQHQVCTAHLLRDLNYINGLYNNQCNWAKDFKSLLQQAILLKKGLTPAEYAAAGPRQQQLFENLRLLLHRPIGERFEKSLSLQKSLLKHQTAILYFLLQPDVPPDNNGSERAIRNVKVKQKISGQYKSTKGADTFAILRSVIDTTIKAGQNVLYALSLIAQLGTE